MKIITTVAEMKAEAARIRSRNKRIGLVPTMGYLHEGHASLIRKAKEVSDVVIVSIFVNPTQFGQDEDFDKYPRDFRRDSEVASKSGADILFKPDNGEMYPEGYKTFVEVEGISKILEGQVRPAHFRGVVTIVAKLFQVANPHVAVFGQKDAQQAFVVQQMARDLNFDAELVIAPIVREHDGLAMSSRNVYLTPHDRPRARALFQSLQYAEGRVKFGERSAKKLRKEMKEIIKKAAPTKIDYIAFVRPSTFSEVETIDSPGVLITLAVRFGSTRLIDNMFVSVNS